MKRLIKDIKDFEGNVVCIGVNDNKIMNVLNKNSSINLYELSRQVSRNILSKNDKLHIVDEISDDSSYEEKWFSVANSDCSKGNALMIVSKYLNIPMAEIYGVITFYSRFTLEPKGKYNISICLGTACFVKGSKEILERAKQRLHLEEGKTSDDGMFSLDTMRCVGACGLAPVFTINGEVYGKATVKKFDEVMDELEKKIKKA